MKSNRSYHDHKLDMQICRICEKPIVEPRTKRQSYHRDCLIWKGRYIEKCKYKGVDVPDNLHEVWVIYNDNRMNTEEDE